MLLWVGDGLGDLGTELETVMNRASPVDRCHDDHLVMLAADWGRGVYMICTDRGVVDYTVYGNRPRNVRRAWVMRRHGLAPRPSMWITVCDPRVARSHCLSVRPPATTGTLQFLRPLVLNLRTPQFTLNACQGSTSSKQLTQEVFCRR